MNNDLEVERESEIPRERRRRPNIFLRGWTELLARILRLDLRETLVATRGFAVDSSELAAHIERIGASFAKGFNGALRSVDLVETMQSLQSVDRDQSGFAFEGAAMGLAVGDFFQPKRNLFDSFIKGPALHHEYMAWVGLGWSFARLPIAPLRTLSRHQSINKWLAIDGFGFHEGYFGWKRSVLEQRRPHSAVGEAGQIFDQGLGRSLWFVLGADPERITNRISAFADERRSDLWSGVGLAATYAGGVDVSVLLRLLNYAKEHRSAFAQGVVFAAEARRRAGNSIPYTESVCDVVLGLPLSSCADIATRCVPRGHDMLAYQEWRRRIQAECSIVLGIRGEQIREK